VRGVPQKNRSCEGGGASGENTKKINGVREARVFKGAPERTRTKGGLTQKESLMLPKQVGGGNLVSRRWRLCRSVYKRRGIWLQYFFVKGSSLQRHQHSDAVKESPCHKGERIKCQKILWMVIYQFLGSSWTNGQNRGRQDSYRMGVVGQTDKLGRESQLKP